MTSEFFQKVWVNSSHEHLVTHLGSLQHGKEVHDEINRIEFQLNVFVGSALIDIYVKCGSMEDAHEVFHTIPKQDVVTWTMIMEKYVQVECFP